MNILYLDQLFNAVNWIMNMIANNDQQIPQLESMSLRQQSTDEGS